MAFNESIEVSANKAAYLAYNKVIIDDARYIMYEQYDIELFRAQSNGQSVTSASKSRAELDKELVDAMAIEKSKSKLRGYNGQI